MTSDEEVIRRMYEAVANGDLESFAERLHPEVVWEHNLGGGSLEEGTYRGRENVVRLFERIIEPWEYIRMEPAEIKPVDDDALLIRGEMRSKHSTTAAEIRTPFEQRVAFEDGLLVRGRITFSQLGAGKSSQGSGVVQRQTR